MMIRKLSRVFGIALLVCSLAVLLAMSAMAYSVNLYGTVDGLESGVDYTVAQYDFASNAYGEYTELTDTTVLTSGIWGIKAGDAEPVALYVYGSESGKISFWDEENLNAVSGIFDNTTTDTFVAGKWTLSSDGAFRNVRCYRNSTTAPTSASVCIDLRKEYVLVYDDEAGAYTTALSGDAQKLQESEVYYGFTNEQVVPGNTAVTYTINNFVMNLGSYQVNTDADYKLTDAKPLFTFYTKQIGSDAVKKYTTTTGTSGKLVVNVPDIPSDEYLVGFSIAPWNGVPDDFLENRIKADGSANTESSGYFHIYGHLSTPECIAIEEPEYAAPTGVSGGMGVVLGLDDSKAYQIASVTLDTTGTTYAIGDWTMVTSETTGLAGLSVVRYWNEDASIGSSSSDIFYISGSGLDRKELSSFGTDGKVLSKASTTNFVPGYFTGDSCSQIDTPYADARVVLDQVLGAPVDAQTLWLYQHDRTTATAKVTEDKSNTYPTWTGGVTTTMDDIVKTFYDEAETKDADTLAAEKAAAQTKLANAIEARSIRYTFDNTEIVDAGIAESITLLVRKRQGSLSYTASTVAVFKVMDLDGTVTDYTWTSDSFSVTSSTAWAEKEVDLAALLPDTGYLVGIQIYPHGAIVDSTITVADGSYLSAKLVNARFIQQQANSGFDVSSYSIGARVLDKLTESEVLDALAGRSDGDFEYASYTLNAAGDGLTMSGWTELTDELPSGLVSVREIFFDGSVTEASDIVFVYGDYEKRQELSNFNSDGVIVAQSNTTKTFTVGKWTGDQAASSKDNFGYYGISTYGGGWFLAGYSTKIVEAQTALDTLNASGTASEEEIAVAEKTLLAAKQTAVNAMYNNGLRYAYESEEIIPISELKTFTFSSKKRMGHGSYSDLVAPTVEVYIADKSGNVSVYSYTGEAKINLSTNGGSEALYAIDFTDASIWTPTLPTEGYVVGLNVIQWSTATDPEKVFVISASTLYNTMPTFTFYPNGYSIVIPDLVRADKPEGLYLEDGIVKGLDATKVYDYIAYGVNGEYGATTVIPKGSTSAELPGGLWAVRIKGDGVTTSSSYPVYFYVPGNSRDNILHTTAMVGTGGAYNGVTINVLDQYDIGGFTDYNRANVTFDNPGVWTGMNLSKLLTLNYGFSPLNLGTISCTVPKDVQEAIKTAAEALAAATTEEETATAQAQLDAARAAAVEAIGDVWYAYKYTQDEVIHMSEFVSHTIKPTFRQGGFSKTSGEFLTKYVLKVACADGTIVDTVAYKTAAFNQSGSKITFSLSDFEYVDGYIVGIVVYPYGAATDDIILNYSSVNNTDINLEVFEDGYVTRAPAAAPEVSVAGATGGVELTITNAIDDVQYAWSADGIEWTTLPKAITIFNIPGATTGETYYVKALDNGIYYDSEATAVVIPSYKPTPALEVTDNTVTDTTGTLEIAKYEFNTDLEYETLTTATLTEGLWAVRTIGDETAMTSAPQYIYIAGEGAGTMTLTSLKSSDFVSGTWTSPNYSSMYSTGATWEAGTIELHFNTNKMYTVEERHSYSIKYQLADDEIIPVSKLTDINATTCGAFFHGWLKDGYTMEDSVGARQTASKGVTLARVYVAGADVAYYDVYTDVTYSGGFTYSVGTQLAGEEGYVTAIELYPYWTIYGPDGVTDIGDDCITSCWVYASSTWATGYTVKFKFSNQVIENDTPEDETLPTGNYWTLATPHGLYANGLNRYAIELKKIESAAPTLSYSHGVITISDYTALKSYVYSTDGGETWTAVTSNKLSVTETSTEYLIKVIENGAYTESEASSVTTPDLMVVGTSLVLDGRIGTRVYLSVNTEVVNIDTVTFHTTRINNDLNSDYGTDYSKYGSCSTLHNSVDFLSRIAYDEAQDLYYFTVYVPAKDVDNVTFQTELNYKLIADGSKVNYGGIGSNLKVSTYISQAKSLAEAGDEAFVAALATINALEDYVAYADNYFGNGTLDAYVSTAATDDVTAPSRTNAELAGVSFYGTSLILEDNVTVRHYFAVSDINAFTAAYTCDIAYGTKGDYIYFDITDIAAQDLGTQQTLTFKTTAGDVAYEINYSAANYMVDMMDDTDANLVSLVNAMYDYYLAAADYAK